jgi:hypothetical protein
MVLEGLCKELITNDMIRRSYLGISTPSTHPSS